MSIITTIVEIITRTQSGNSKGKGVTVGKISNVSPGATVNICGGDLKITETRIKTTIKRKHR